MGKSNQFNEAYHKNEKRFFKFFHGTSPISNHYLLLYDNETKKEITFFNYCYFFIVTQRLTNFIAEQTIRPLRNLFGEMINKYYLKLLLKKYFKRAKNSLEKLSGCTQKN